MPNQPLTERAVTVAPNHAVSLRVKRTAPSYQSGVNAFFRSTVATYTSDAIKVAPTFAMGRGYPDQQDAKNERSATHKTLAQLAASAGLDALAFKRLQMGRGTPAEFRMFTQAAITSMGVASGGTWTWLDIRTIMYKRATGFDCAGYVQQAYLLATGRTRDQLGWLELSSEGLFDLPGHGFRKFDRVTDLLPGDIIVFKASDSSDHIEHRTIVFDQRVATDDDARAIAGARGLRGVTPSGPEFAGAGATIRVLEMDSSYGCNHHAEWGGVQRQTWLFNEATGKWASLQRDERDPANASRWITFVGGLYGMSDVLEGFYRHRAD